MHEPDLNSITTPKLRHFELGTLFEKLLCMLC